MVVEPAETFARAGTGVVQAGSLPAAPVSAVVDRGPGELPQAPSEAAENHTDHQLPGMRQEGLLPSAAASVLFTGLPASRLSHAQNAAFLPQIRAKRCQACEAPSSPAATTKIYCSKRCSRWAYINRRLDRGLPPLPRPRTSFRASNRTAASSAGRHSPEVRMDRSG
jgi:hypothetical protein